MRKLALALMTLAVSGCSSEMFEAKKPIPLDEVPESILKIAREQHPGYEFTSAFTEVEDGQPVYELMAKAKNGKIIEVEVTKDGKILK